MATLDHPITETERTNIQKICGALGVIFLFVGIVGFLSPAFLGLHLSPVNNLLHLLTGLLAVWVGYGINPMAATRFTLWAGAIYIFVGVLGFLTGDSGWATVGSMGEERFLMRVFPGSLEFGTNDHVAHLFLGVILLLSGIVSHIQSGNRRDSTLSGTKRNYPGFDDLNHSGQIKSQL